MGVSLLAEAVQALRVGESISWGVVLSCLLALAGLALLVGTLTPIAAAPAAVALLARVVSQGAPGVAAEAGDAWALVVVIAVGLLGPGAYSVDARLFGRREIEVPRPVRR